jgi:hypothetical protein
MGPQRRVSQTLAKATAKRRGDTRWHEHGERIDGLASEGHSKMGASPPTAFLEEDLNRRYYPRSQVTLAIEFLLTKRAQSRFLTAT